MDDEETKMIGCLICGGVAALVVGRAMHHRRMYSPWLGCHRGGWSGGGFGRGWGDPRGGVFRGSDAADAADAWEPRFGGYELGEPPFGGFGRRRHRHGKRMFVRAILEHVRATPAQERIIGAAVEEFADELKKTTGGEGRRSRQEIVDAFRKPSFDGVMLGEQFARHDTAIESARKAFVGLVAKLHDALEPEQRERLAELIERGPRFGRWTRGW
jgi:uncharacterized membrane protein